MSQFPPRFHRKHISAVFQATVTATALTIPLLASAADVSGITLETYTLVPPNGSGAPQTYTSDDGKQAVIAGYASGNATSNTVRLSNLSTAGNLVFGGLALSGSANSNQVIFNNVTDVGRAIGGMAVNQNGNADIVAKFNTVDVTSSVVNQIIGGSVDTASQGGGSASDNTVIIRSGSIGQAGIVDDLNQNDPIVAGGIVDTGGESHRNTVTILGGTFSAGAIVGGVAWSGVATSNTINIVGNNANLSNVGLYGGYTENGGDAFTGNTLNLIGVKGMAVHSVQNFENLNFYLPEDTKNGDTILNVAGTADIRGSTIGVAVQGQTPTLAVGEKVNLIDAVTLRADPTIKTKGLQGSTIEYEFNTQQVGDKLVSTVTKRGATEASKSLAEGFVAGAAALTGAADFATSQGTAAAVSAAAGSSSAPGGQSFGTTGGGSIRNNTGSHVDVKGFNLVAGVAKGFNLEAGKLTLGGFFEYGTGNYSSYNDFTSGTVQGTGDTRSYGLGLLAQFAFASGIYVEGSVRGGLADQSYQSDSLSPGSEVAYDSHTNYVGSHIGLGKIWTLTDSLNLDTYAQYIWQRQSGDTVTLSSGETLAFMPVNSQRGRLGTRLEQDFNKSITGYIGAAYEEEFDGQADATTNGLPITSPSMKGSSGMVELGVKGHPLSDKAFTLGGGVQGYFGQKQGVTGNLIIGYLF